MFKERIDCNWNIEWHNVRTTSPTEEQVEKHEGEFLCYAAYPGDNGEVEFSYVIVSYNYKSKKWQIYDYILLYWAELPNLELAIF